MPFKDLSCENGIVAVYMHYNAVPKTYTSCANLHVRNSESAQIKKKKNEEAIGLKKFFFNLFAC